MSTTSDAIALAPDRLAQADLFRFLSACYYEPEAAFLEERLFDSMAAAAARVSPGLANLARRLGDAFAAQPMDELRIDYARLFVGPSPVYMKPYGAVWTQGIDLVAVYAQNGFDIATDFPERPDHIALELEFLYRLLLAGRPHEEFLNGHLRKWVSGFAREVAAGADTDFYRQLAQLTQHVI